MKVKLFYLFILASLIPNANLLAQQFEEPAAYNNYIVGEQNKVLAKVIEYIVQSVHNEDFSAVENKRLQVIGQIETAIQRIEKLEPFEKGDKLKLEALEVLKLYKEAYKEDFSEINVLKKNRESSFEAMEQYFEAQDKAELKMNKTAERFNNAQKAFIEKHALIMEEAEKDKTMEVISNVNKYSRDVFLEYFRISKLNAACLDALSAQNPDLLEKKRVALLEGANTAYMNSLK